MVIELDPAEFRLKATFRPCSLGNDNESKNLYLSGGQEHSELSRNFSPSPSTSPGRLTFQCEMVSLLENGFDLSLFRNIARLNDIKKYQAVG